MVFEGLSHSDPTQTLGIWEAIGTYISPVHRCFLTGPRGIQSWLRWPNQCGGFALLGSWTALSLPLLRRRGEEERGICLYWFLFIFYFETIHLRFQYGSNMFPILDTEFYSSDSFKLDLFCKYGILLVVHSCTCLSKCENSHLYHSLWIRQTCGSYQTQAILVSPLHHSFPLSLCILLKSKICNVYIQLTGLIRRIPSRNLTGQCRVVIIIETTNLLHHKKYGNINRL